MSVDNPSINSPRAVCAGCASFRSASHHRVRDHGGLLPDFAHDLRVTNPASGLSFPIPLPLLPWAWCRRPILAVCHRTPRSPQGRCCSARIFILGGKFPVVQLHTKLSCCWRADCGRIFPGAFRRLSARSSRPMSWHRGNRVASARAYFHGAWLSPNVSLCLGNRRSAKPPGCARRLAVVAIGIVPPRWRF